MTADFTFDQYNKREIHPKVISEIIIKKELYYEQKAQMVGIPCNCNDLRQYYRLCWYGNNSRETVQNSSSIKEESQNQMISILIPLRLYGILMNPQRIIKGQETRSED